MGDTNKHPLQTLCEMADIECRDYSGRGMYGRSCLGIEISDMGEFFCKILEAVEGEDDTRLIQDAFANMSQDSMGRDMIVYFPRVDFIRDEEDEEDEEDHDCEGDTCCTPARVLSST